MAQVSLLHFVGDDLANDLKCTGCELACSPYLRTNKMAGVGPSGATFFFCGQAPGDEDDTLGTPFSAGNGTMFRKLLRDADVDARDSYFTNCCKCATFGKTLKKRSWDACKEYLAKEIAEIKPKVICALGAQAFAWLTGFSGASKFYRKSLPCILDPSYEVYPLRQPAQIYHVKDDTEKATLERKMVEDLQWLKAHVSKLLTKTPQDLGLDYKTITTHAEVLELFAELETHDELSIDLETTSLFPHPEDNILAIGFSWGPRQGRALPLYAVGVLTAFFWEDGYVEKELVPRIQHILRTKTVFGHNLVQFDQKWTRAKLGCDLNIKFDTMLAHYAIDEEQGTHGLEQLAVLYAEMSAWKRDFTTQDTVQLCEYLCKDVDAVSRLKPILQGLMTKDEKWLLEQLLLPLAQELFEIEYTGIRVSEDNLNRLEELLTTKIDKAELDIQCNHAVRAFCLDNNKEFDSESPHHVRDVMQNYLKLKKVKSTDSGLYSTDKEVLANHQQEPFVASLLESRRLRKLRSTYCGQIRDALRDGFVHTTYKVHGTVTGRPSSSTPNLMNIPREDTVAKVLEDGSLIKQMFLSDPGYIMVQADLNQAELRVLGSISGDKQLCGIYLRGEDAHTATAAIVYDIALDQVTKAQRSGAKKINFGIPYGMSEQGLIAAFVAEGGTERGARDFLQIHKRKFYDVWNYMEDQARVAKLNRKQTTAFGRSRRYSIVDERALRQAYNYPIQSLASDVTLLSLVRIAKAIRMMGIKARTILTVYDSIAWSVHPDDFWRLVDLAHHVMTTISFPWMKVPMGVDIEAGWNWGKLEKLDLKSRTIKTS